MGLWKQRREKEASQRGHWNIMYVEAGEQPLVLTTRRPLVVLVEVVSGEWRSQKQDQGEPRRAWEARLEEGGLPTGFRKSGGMESKR